MTKLGVIICAVAVMLAVPATAAGDVEDTLRTFGLVGRWAEQCDMPAGYDNNSATFSIISPDEAQERIEFGAGSRPNIYTINAAEILKAAPNEVRLDVDFNDHRQHFIIRLRDNTIQTVSNFDGDGRVLIKDGVSTMSGRTAATLMRCN